ACVVERKMRRHAVTIGGDALVDRGRGEGAFHRAQHPGAGPERVGERDRFEVEAGRLEARGKALPALGELAGRGALERKDRLLFVADRKYRARDAVSRAMSGGKFG